MSVFDAIFSDGAECLDDLHTQTVTLYRQSGETSTVSASVGKIQTNVEQRDHGRVAVLTVPVTIRAERLAAVYPTDQFRLASDDADDRWTVQSIGKTGVHHAVTLTRTETLEHHRDNYRRSG